MTVQPNLITLVIPVYNEAKSIRANLNEIMRWARQVPNVDYEVLLVDDGSHDDTAQIIHDCACSDPALRTLVFTRNFGKEAAIQAGLEAATGAAVIVMDSDLQHPPELIVDMIRLWRAGVPVVEAIKQQRAAEERLINQWGAMLFYRLFKILSGLDLRGQSDYKLLDRQIVDDYLSWPEKERFFRGLISWAHFPCAQLPFAVPAGSRHHSRWRWWTLARYALDNLTNFSSLPLRIFSVLGFIVLLMGTGIGVLALWQKFQGSALDGFTTINLLVIAIGGTILLGIGIIGHYLAKIYEEIKRRPGYVLRKQDPL
jgi:dolichol-phosphate mannosyltransferase